MQAAYIPDYAWLIERDRAAGAQSRPSAAASDASAPRSSDRQWSYELGRRRSPFQARGVAARVPLGEL
jgi:hypothetical protein